MVLISFNCDRCGGLQGFRPRTSFSYAPPLICDRCLKRVPFDAYSARNDTIKQMGFNDYREYLASEKWQDIRQRVLDRDGGNCVLCLKPATNVHHHLYSAEALIGIDLNPLHSLCGGCHYGIEFDQDGKKLDLPDAMKKLRKCLKHKCSPYELGAVIRDKTEAFKNKQRMDQAERDREAAAARLMGWIFTE